MKKTEATAMAARRPKMAGRLDEPPAGEGAVGIVVGAILTILLVLAVTDLLGPTDGISFRPVADTGSEQSHGGLLRKAP